MKTYFEYRELAKQLIAKQEEEKQSMINTLLNQIEDRINNNNGLIHFGNCNFFMHEGNVYECTSWTPYNDYMFKYAVKLYSDDGWNDLESIASFLDNIDKFLETKK